MGIIESQILGQADFTREKCSQAKKDELNLSRHSMQWNKALKTN